MAGPGKVQAVSGQNDTFGGKFFTVADYTGVASYVNGTGELLSPTAFGCPNTILSVIGESIAISGDYYVVCQPKGTGLCQWYARWFVVATGVEVANAVNLSAKTVKLSVIGF
jgi:hypothetical protein